MNIKELQNFIENRIYFKTNDPNYIVKQCENLDFKYDEKDIYDFKKTIRDLEVHYNL